MARKAGSKNADKPTIYVYSLDCKTCGKDTAKTIIAEAQINCVHGVMYKYSRKIG